MEKKKRIALSAGLLAAALLFNPGVLASDDTQEENQGRRSGAGASAIFFYWTESAKLSIFVRCAV